MADTAILRFPLGTERPKQSGDPIETFILYEIQYLRSVRRRFPIGVFSTLDLASETVARRVRDNYLEMRFAYGSAEIERLFSFESVSALYEAERLYLDREQDDDWEYYYFRMDDSDSGCYWLTQKWPEVPEDIAKEVCALFPTQEGMVRAVLRAILGKGVPVAHLKEVAEFKLSKTQI